MARAERKAVDPIVQIHSTIHSLKKIAEADTDKVVAGATQPLPRFISRSASG
jgi:hypothetical protein